MSATTLDTVQVDDLTIAYRDLGSGPAVLLLHGWPTSSFLWRHVMPPLAVANRVIAPDLPGFGASSKPLDARYDHDLHERALDGLLEALEIERVGIVVHDLGGPVGLRWGLRRPRRLTKVALLNALVYPEFPEEVLDFVRRLSSPDTRDALTSPQGLEQVLRLGLADESNLTAEVVAGVTEPFAEEDARLALAKAALELDPGGFVEIAERLPSLAVPVRIVYGEQDRVLPDVAQTMARVKRDLPATEVTALPGVGHFLQEEQPERVGELLAEFFAA